jgi:hypothetical protein
VLLVINLLIYVILFAIAAYGLWWVCQKFGMPQPVVWICGGLLLIIILLFLANQLGVGAASVFPLRR